MSQTEKVVKCDVFAYEKCVFSCQNESDQKTHKQAQFYI